MQYPRQIATETLTQTAAGAVIWCGGGLMLEHIINKYMIFMWRKNDLIDRLSGFRFPRPATPLSRKVIRKDYE